MGQDTQSESNSYRLQSVSEKRHPFYICDNLIIVGHPILPIIGRNIYMYPQGI